MAQGLKRIDETGLIKERSRSPDCEVDGDLFGGREKTLFVDVSNTLYCVCVHESCCPWLCAITELHRCW